MIIWDYKMKTYIIISIIIGIFVLGYLIGYSHGIIKGIEISLDFAKKHLDFNIDTKQLAQFILKYHNTSKI